MSSVNNLKIIFSHLRISPFYGASKKNWYKLTEEKDFFGVENKDNRSLTIEVIAFSCCKQNKLSGKNPVSCLVQNLPHTTPVSDC